MSAPIKTWSHTRLVHFDTCKLKARLMFGDRIPEPEQELKPGEVETGLQRGIRLHQLAEAFVKGSDSIPEELKPLRKEFLPLQSLFKQNKVVCEEEWAFDHAWKPIAWDSPDAWLRLKCDAVVRISPKHTLVIDYKTGRRWGNELKHGEQLELYALCIFLRDEAVDTVTAEVWYLDQNEIVSKEFSRKDMPDILKRFHKRAVEFTTCTDFPPNPNMFSCRYCPYSKRGTGHCDKGI